MKKKIEYLIGRICFRYRREVLSYSLEEFSTITGIKISTLSHFENGRSKNLNILFSYLKLLDENEKQNMLNEIYKVM